MKDKNGVQCPNCGGTNIKKIGVYYQCQTITGIINFLSCGYIGESTDFNIRTPTKLI